MLAAAETSPGSHLFSTGPIPYEGAIQAEDGHHQNSACKSLGSPTDSSYVNDPQPSLEQVETFPGSDISPGSGPYDEIVPPQPAGGHQKPAYESLDPPKETTYVNDPQPSPYTALNPIQNPKPGSVGKLASRGSNPVQDMDAGEYIHTTGSPNYESLDYVEIVD